MSNRLKWVICVIVFGIIFGLSPIFDLEGASDAARRAFRWRLWISSMIMTMFLITMMEGNYE